MASRIPKVRVCHNSKEFTVLKAIMGKIRAQKVHSGVTNNEEDSISNRMDRSSRHGPQGNQNAATVVVNTGAGTLATSAAAVQT